MGCVASPPIRNTATASDNLCACSSNDPAAAAACSTNAAFCCVTSSICATATLTWSMPVLCSAAAAAISFMISLTRDGTDDFPHRRTGALDQPRAGLHAGRGSIDQAFDLLGRSGATLRQRAHLARHHGEAATLFAGAGRFHRRIEG